MLTIMTSSETERLTKSIKDEFIEEHQQSLHHQKISNDDIQHDNNEDESVDIQNPFVHKVEWNDPYDKIRVSAAQNIFFC